MSVNTIFRNLEEYYRDNGARARSPEAGYGVHWKETGSESLWGASYVRHTGEVYVMRLADRGPVEVLGAFPVDEDAGIFDVYYRGMEAHLAGWAERCGLPGSLGWLRERMGLAVRHGGAVPGESTHLLGRRSVLGTEAALCGAKDGLILIPRHMTEAEWEETNCSRCRDMQDAGPEQVEAATPGNGEDVSCRCCGQPAERWRDERQQGAVRESWAGGTRTAWVCGWCITDSGRRFGGPGVTPG